MSDLDDLCDIADQSDAAGYAGATTRRPGRPLSPPVCDSPNHMQAPNIRFYTDHGKRRQLCKLCDKVRRKKRAVTYRPQEYPL